VPKTAAAILHHPALPVAQTAGANYIIQLTGIGGLVPNTVLVDWPEAALGETQRGLLGPSGQ